MINSNKYSIRIIKNKEVEASAGTSFKYFKRVLVDVKQHLGW